METKCYMINCDNSAASTHFFPFPKNFDVCMQWVQNCGTAELFEDFAYGGAQPFLKRNICSDHFETTDFIDPSNPSLGLKNGSVPIKNFIDMDDIKQESDDNDSNSDDDSFTNKSRLNDTVTAFINLGNIKHERENADEDVSSHPRNSEALDSQYKFKEEPLDSSLPNSSVFPLLLMPNWQELKEKPLSSKQFRMAWKKALDSADDKIARNSANAQRTACKRANETEEQKQKRNHANADRAAKRRAVETDKQRGDRLYKNALRAALRRSLESDEQQKERRRKNALRAACRRAMESPQQRTERRMKDMLRSAQRRKQESELQAKIRRYNDAVRAAYRRSNETDAQRERRKMYDVLRAARRRSMETPEQREARLKADRERAARRRLLKKVSENVNNNLSNPDRYSSNSNESLNDQESAASLLDVSYSQDGTLVDNIEKTNPLQPEVIWCT